MFWAYHVPVLQKMHSILGRDDWEGWININYEREYKTISDENRPVRCKGIQEILSQTSSCLCLSSHFSFNCLHINTAQNITV